MKPHLTTSPVSILYASLGTNCFREVHSVLVKAAKEGMVRYVVRLMLPSGCEASSIACAAVGSKASVNLGGYGVELALKNMEYQAMDDSTVKKSVTLEDAHTEDLSQEVRGFIFSKILKRKPEFLSEIMAFQDYLFSSTVSDTLDIWELKDLGHQTAQKIVHSSDPLQAMQDINQNFPSIVSSLSRMKLNESVKEEILANQRMVPPGKSLMTINGALVNIEDIDLFLLVDLVHKELSLADQFSKLKIPDPNISKLLSTTPSAESTTFRIDCRSRHVHYLKNLESWRSNVNDILRPTFPGQLRYIRKNLFHAVYMVDSVSSCGLEVIDSIISLYENQFHIRFGVILYSKAFIKEMEITSGESAKNNHPEEDISTSIIRYFYYIDEQHGVQTAFKFLSNINNLCTDFRDGEDEALERHMVEKAFVETVMSKSKSLPQDELLKVTKENF